MDNYMTLEIPGKSQNEAFARVVVAAFASQLDPTLEEINDIKTAVSEAVTNAVIHAYPREEGKIILRSWLNNNCLEVEVIDYGTGIQDLEIAREPLYTSRPDLERSGMGFSLMEKFMDKLEVVTVVGQGTLVKMQKVIRRAHGDSGS